MIRSARVRHRLMITLLAVALPVALAAALMARTPRPAPLPLPASLSQAVSVGARAQKLGAGSWQDPRLEWRLARPTDGTPRVELRARESLAQPDVLLYWSPTARGDGEASGGLPDPAWLLGRLAGTAWVAFTLPEAARDRPGRLLLYSLAHQQVLDQADLGGDGG